MQAELTYSLVFCAGTFPSAAKPQRLEFVSIECNAYVLFLAINLFMLYMDIPFTQMKYVV